jgi:hypothetical protein
VLSLGGSLQLTLNFAEPSAKFAKLRQIGDQVCAHTAISNNSPANDIAAERADLTLIRRSTPSRRCSTSERALLQFIRQLFMGFYRAGR